METIIRFCIENLPISQKSQNNSAVIAEMKFTNLLALFNGHKSCPKCTQHSGTR